MGDHHVKNKKDNYPISAMCKSKKIKRTKMKAKCDME